MYSTKSYLFIGCSITVFAILLSYVLDDRNIPLSKQNIQKRLREKIKGEKTAMDYLLTKKSKNHKDDNNEGKPDSKTRSVEEFLKRHPQYNEHWDDLKRRTQALKRPDVWFESPRPKVEIESSSHEESENKKSNDHDDDDDLVVDSAGYLPGRIKTLVDSEKNSGSDNSREEEEFKRLALEKKKEDAYNRMKEKLGKS